MRRDDTSPARLPDEKDGTCSTAAPARHQGGGEDAGGGANGREASCGLSVEEVGALYRRYAQRVACWAALLGGPAVDMEDVTQDVFLALHRALPRFVYRSEAELIGWLYRTTANEVRYRRRRGRFWAWLTRDGQNPPRREPSTVLTPVEELERREARALVHRALGRLSERDRTLLMLFEMEGLPGEEIARLTGVRISTLWVQLHRARARFVDAMTREESSAKDGAPETPHDGRDRRSEGRE